MAVGTRRARGAVRSGAAAVLAPVTAAVLLVWAGATAAAQDAAPQEAVCDSREGANQIVDSLIRDWKIGDATFRSLEERGVSVIEGLADIGLLASHADWGKARSVAYTKAYLDAMGAFVQQTNEEIATQTVRDLLHDATSIPVGAEEDAAAYLERVDGKAAALVEMHLDQALKEAGMSDDDLAELSGTQKIPRYRDAIVRETTSRAFGQAAGLVPLKTFEAVDCDGNSAVGVVAAFSTRMRALAEQVQNGEPIRPNPDRAGTSLRDRIAALSDEDLATQFGVRIWWDRDGYPVIVSFGQWGWSTKALTAAQRNRRYRFAQDQAAIQAKSYLAEFIQVNAQLTSSSFVGSTIEEAVEVGADGFNAYVSSAAITDRMVEEARTKSTVQLTGLGTLRTWSSQHPVAEHQELTGAVAYWSPAQENAVRASLGLDAKHPEPEPEPAPAAETEQQPTVSGTVQSKDLMDASDF